MELLLYIDNKILGISPDNLINNILSTGIKGFEVSFDIFSYIEANYLKRLAELCKKNKLKLQVHAHIHDNIEKQLDFYQEVSIIYGNNINIVNHPVSSENIYLAQEQTNILFSKILNYIYIKQYNLLISIENLSSRVNTIRLSKKLLLPILSNNEDLYFTYNIGNEIKDYGKIIDLQKLFIERLNNVHIYTFDLKSNHKAITKNDPIKMNIIKGLTYLKQNDYNGTLVLDYDFSLFGDNNEQRLKEYIESAKFILEYIK